MPTHLRFALVPLLFLACAPSGGDRGCQVDPAGGACLGDPSPLTGDIALDSIAHVSAAAKSEAPGDVEVQVSTDTPDLLRVLDARVTVPRCSTPTVRVKALKEGPAVVRFTYPDGKSSSASVTVSLATRAELVPFLDDTVKSTKARGGETLPVSPTREIVQVVGGKMIWRVRYSSASGAALRGSGATTYSLPQGATSTLVENDKDREIFELTTASVNGGKLELRAASTTLELPVRVVPPEGVATVRLFVEDDADGENGAKSAGADGGASAKKAQLHVLARAFDATGATIFGVPFTFTLGTEIGPPGGDLLSYDFDPSAAKRPLVATVSGSPARAETTLSVASPANLSGTDGRELVSCSFGHGLGGAESLAEGLAFGGLVLALARRRRSRPTAEA